MLRPNVFLEHLCAWVRVYCLSTYVGMCFNYHNVGIFSKMLPGRLFNYTITLSIFAAKLYEHQIGIVCAII